MEFEFDDHFADWLPPKAASLSSRTLPPVALGCHVADPTSACLDDHWADPVRPARKRLAAGDTPAPTVRRRLGSGSGGGWAAPPQADEANTEADGDSPEWHITSTDHNDILRWVECSRVGRAIEGTRLIPCKTPFEGRMAEAAYREELLGEQERFERRDLLGLCEERGTPVGLVVDLANTKKYYEGFDCVEGVEYKKLWLRGHATPPLYILKNAFDDIDEFTARNPTKYVVIHCTHGVNRTGFFIAAYLLSRKHVNHAGDAIAAFRDARGEVIDKSNLILALHRLEAKGWY